ncbi:MAG: NAD(P)-dependent oxidoreductase [Acidobacteria bacterium]|nr:NAD(P)-dependent oxidoreductase [Acidobacteriota bacterium]
MRILVTGGSGLIGGYLAAALASEGHSVLATYRCNPKASLNVPGIEVHQLDLSQPIDRLPAAEVVVHTAAHTHLIPNSTAEQYVNSNVIAMLNLVEYARKVGATFFINLSTLSVYGEIAVAELTETTPPVAPGLYGASKRLAEEILHEQQWCFSAISARLPGVVGKGYFTPWVGTVLKRALHNQPIVIYNPESLFNNIVDLAEIHRWVSHLIQKSFHGSEVVNFASSEPVTIRELVETVVTLAGSRSAIQESDAPRKSFLISIEKLRRVCNFEPQATRDIVRRYVLENTVEALDAQQRFNSGPQGGESAATAGTRRPSHESAALERGSETKW